MKIVELRKIHDICIVTYFHLFTEHMGLEIHFAILHQKYYIYIYNIDAMYNYFKKIQVSTNAEDHINI